MTLFRVSVGLFGLWVYFRRLPWTGNFYSEEGPMPGGAIATYLPRSRLAPHLWFNTDLWTAALVLLAAVLSLALIRGRYPRAAALALALLSVSHNLRYPFALTGADTYLPWLYFLAAVLPWSAPFVLFVALPFYVAGLAKWNSPHWINGSALGVFTSPLWAKPWVRSLADEWDLGFLSMIVPAAEILFAFAIITSLIFPAIRGGLALAALAFHGAVFATMNVDDVSIPSSILWIPIISSWRSQAVDAAGARDLWIAALGSALMMFLFLRPQHVREFSHFRNARSAILWPRFLGAVDGQPLKEIFIAHGTAAAPSDPDSGTDVFAVYYNSDRHWLKFLQSLVLPSQGPARMALTQNYLCRRFGPASGSGFERFEWRYAFLNRGPYRERILHLHECPREGP